MAPRRKPTSPWSYFSYLNVSSKIMPWFFAQGFTNGDSGPSSPHKWLLDSREPKRTTSVYSLFSIKKFWHIQCLMSWEHSNSDCNDCNPWILSDEWTRREHTWREEKRHQNWALGNPAGRRSRGGGSITPPHTEKCLFSRYFPSCRLQVTNHCELLKELLQAMVLPETRLKSFKYLISAYKWMEMLVNNFFPGFEMIGYILPE